MAQNNKNVLIITPARDFAPCYVKSLFNTVQHCDRNNINLTFIQEGGSHIGQLREVLAFMALINHPEYTHMFWIDSDMSWTVSDFCALLESPHMVTCGMYAIKSDGSLSIIIKRSQEELSMKTKNSKEYLEVDYKFAQKEDIEGKPRYVNIEASGFGFVCFKNGVFENLHSPYFANIEEEEFVSLDGRPVKMMVTSEDAALFKRAKIAGFDAVLDSTVKVGHFKSSIWMP
jgi:hypothetical protein